MSQGGRRGRWRTPAVCALLVATVVCVVPPAGTGATLPNPGLLVPGQSLGGVRLGMTGAQVRAQWGTAYGRCRSCARERWYFNYRPFTPQGAAVAFARGRVTHVFTVWQPLGWRSTKGVVLGELEGEVERLHGELERVSCGRYAARLLPGRRARTAFYVYDGVVWGFGLMRRAASPCLPS